ncbi:hypothetical protein SAMN04489864_104252 [Pedobacter insulae]|uniref:Uncharacterized protein n=1 Tax=Pedobacter insulae TaxID=414048 RepID=A0A1I2WUB8_9SPHI|nr:hypothetical protein SAMN04489864_104252 [Pedobacter insulae]
MTGIMDGQMISLEKTREISKEIVNINGLARSERL